MMNLTILITGSTDGIGKLVAEKLANDGHHIFIHGRSQEKINNTITALKASTGNEHIEGFEADFSDLTAVKSMGEAIKNKLSKIDVLINNAGVFKSSNPTNKDGLDLRLVVNYLAPFVLTEALIPLLQKGQQPRLINLSSAAQASVSYDVLHGRAEVSQQASYAQSKLALTMWSFDLAKKLDGINVIAVNPGSLLNTRMAKEAYGQHWSPADKGANILYDLAVGKKHEGLTGKYFDNDRGAYGPAHKDAYDDAKIDRLMKETEAIVA